MASLQSFLNYLTNAFPCTSFITAFFKLCVAFLLFIQLTPANAEVFKWVDEQGITHFSHQPPDRKVTSFSELSKDVTYVNIVPAPEHLAQGNVGDTTTKSKSGIVGRRKHAGHAKLAKERKTKTQQCKARLRKIDKLDAQLARAYTEPRGNRLREERRELSSYYNLRCR